MVTVGLKGGTFHTNFGQNQLTTMLDQVRFAKDVRVDGTVTWGTDGSLAAELHLSGAATAGGTIHVTGSWQAPGPPSDFTVSGNLGGHHVAALVHEQ